MCYMIPGDITIDGQPIRGGTDINPSDYEFIGKIYPRAANTVSSTAPEHQAVHQDDWDESEDVTEILV